MPGVRISVIIPTFNRVEYLQTCLASLEQQTFDHGRFELIVVNDGSTDSTDQYLNRFSKQTTLKLTVISHPNRGVSASRNVGIHAAGGQLIAFTDDDCIVPSDWLARMDALWDTISPDVAGIGGPLDCAVRGESGYLSDYIEFLDEFNYIPVLRRWGIVPVHVSKLHGNEQIAYLRTSNAAFRKTCLDEVCGFDEQFKKPGGEDPDLCYRMLNRGYCFKVYPALRVTHKTRDSFGSYFNAMRNYIRGEFRKHEKRKNYNIESVQRSYRLFVGRKIASLLISIGTLPAIFSVLLTKQQYPFFERLTFPFLMLAAKAYALGISVYYQLSRHRAD